MNGPQLDIPRDRQAELTNCIASYARSTKQLCTELHSDVLQQILVQERKRKKIVKKIDIKPK